MGIAFNAMEGLIREAKFRSFEGLAYTFGRQTMGLSPEGTNALFMALDLSPAGGPAQPDRVDTVTSGAEYLRDKPIRDVDFFKMAGFSEVKAIDVSGFEGAEIILDLNADIPVNLHGTCDLLVDGSLLDNVFDPISGLRNAIKLLRANGRLYLSNAGNYSPHIGGIPYLMFNPMWFYDYFCINEFADCQVYVTVYEPNGQLTFFLGYEYTLRGWGNGLIKPIVSEYPIQISVFAERNDKSTWHRTPTQHVYRSDAEWDNYEAIVRSFIERGRPLLMRSKGTTVSQTPSTGWLLCLPDGTLKDFYR
jgi:SAM-dependent methyltransferase